MFGKTHTYVYAWDTKPKRTDPSVKPKVDLKLVYAPTYNGKNARNNIKFVDYSNIMFFVSVLLIAYFNTDFYHCSYNEYRHVRITTTTRTL